MRYVSGRYDPGEPDPAALTLDDLYRRHSAWLGWVLRRRFGARVCSDDLVQETFVRAARLPTPDIHNARALLWRIAQRLALDQLRRLRRAEAAVALTSEPQHAAASQDADVLMQELIADLPQTVRDTFVLSRFAGLTYEEIARRQGVSIKAVEWRMPRALDLLAARLAE